MTKHPFSQYISSEREEGIATLSAKKNPTKVLVYVEDITDVGFWHGILSPYEKSNNIKFDISPPYSENNLTTGKDQLIKLFPNTDKYFIICLDSDYDYLLQSELAQTVKNNPYIFQTYAYAVENLKCYAESLNSLCVKATNNTDEIVDLSYLLLEYSKIIYPLLVWNLYYYAEKNHAHFSISDFCKIVTLDSLTTVNYASELTSLKSSVDSKLSTFPVNVTLENFTSQLNNLGLNETNSYLFMNGHALYDFMAKFLIKICDTLKASYISEIEKIAKTDEELRNKKGHYYNAIKATPITFLLANNEKFTDCFIFKEKIKKDIESYLATFKHKQLTQGMNS